MRRTGRIGRGSGRRSATAEAVVPPYVADCYLCPGNARVSGARNPTLHGHVRLRQRSPVGRTACARGDRACHGIYRNRPASGLARVVCYSPRHDLTLAELEPAEVDRLLEVWQEQYRDLGGRDGIDHVLVFENKGEVVGVSNPHPHCQIYATNFVFKTIETEVRARRAAPGGDGPRAVPGHPRGGARRRPPHHRRERHGDRLSAVLRALCVRSLRRAEGDAPEPRGAVRPPSVATLRPFSRTCSIRFDNLWQMPFPYVMPLHQAPTDGGDYPRLPLPRRVSSAACASPTC